MPTTNCPQCFEVLSLGTTGCPKCAAIFEVEEDWYESDAAQQHLDRFNNGFTTDYQLNYQVNWHWLYLLPFLIILGHLQGAAGDILGILISAPVIVGASVWGIRRTYQHIKGIELSLLMRDVEIEQLKNRLLSDRE